MFDSYQVSIIRLLDNAERQEVMRRRGKFILEKVLEKVVEGLSRSPFGGRKLNLF